MIREVVQVVVFVTGGASTTYSLATVQLVAVFAFISFLVL